MTKQKKMKLWEERVKPLKCDNLKKNCNSTQMVKKSNWHQAQKHKPWQKYIKKKLNCDVTQKHKLSNKFKTQIFNT